MRPAGGTKPIEKDDAAPHLQWEAGSKTSSSSPFDGEKAG
jgi:hypothetical protein